MKCKIYTSIGVESERKRTHQYFFLFAFQLALIILCLPIFKYMNNKIETHKFKFDIEFYHFVKIGQTFLLYKKK